MSFGVASREALEIRGPGVVGPLDRPFYQHHFEECRCSLCTAPDGKRYPVLCSGIISVPAKFSAGEEKSTPEATHK